MAGQAQDPRLQLAQRITFGSYGLLLLLMLLWPTLLSPPESLPVSFALLLGGIPLLLPLRGMLAGKRLSYTLLSFVALLYLIHGVMEAWSGAGEMVQQLGLLEALLAAVVHLGAGFTVRYSAPPKITD